MPARNKISINHSRLKEKKKEKSKGNGYLDVIAVDYLLTKEYGHFDFGRMVDEWVNLTEQCAFL